MTGCLRLICISISVVLLISCAACGAAYKPFWAAFEDTAHLFDISAASAVVFKNGETMWEGRCGQLSNIKGLYCIGSVSKSFVAVLSLMLEEDGSISLDDSAAHYLPDIDLRNKEAATLRDLLSMRSGIADYTDGFDTEDYFKEYDAESLISAGVTDSAFSRQGDFLYSNTNILIAQQMIEKATGQSCQELIRNKILIPLGLCDTFFAEEKQQISKRIVPGFSNTVNGDIIDFTETAASWAGLACGMYSTAGDMAKWASALQSAELLSEESRKKLFDFLPVDNNTDYGLCVIRKKTGAADIIALQGNVPGYSCTIYMRDGFSIAVLCSLSDYSGNGISYSEEIADSLMEEAAAMRRIDGQA